MSTYTPEQIKKAMDRIEHLKDVEHKKYERNKAHRLAYSKAYYENNKDAIAEKHKIAYAIKNPKPSKVVAIVETLA